MAAILGLAGAYMFTGGDTKEEAPQQIAAEKAEKPEQSEVAQKNDSEQETEQTARASAVIRPEDDRKEPKKYTKTASKKDEKKDEKKDDKEDVALKEENQEAQKEEDKQETAEVSATNAPAATELHFNTDAGLIWPVDGAVILDYSMDQTIYFTTLDQYKYNPAVIIAGNVNDKVKAAANGKITDISTNEVTGCTVTMDLGDGYTAIYGQLKEVPYEAGAYLEAGNTIGFVNEPTKYYSMEGSNLYFELEKDGVPIDPVGFFAAN